MTAHNVTPTFGCGGFEFRAHHFNSHLPVPSGEATARKIGRIGAYTHALGHYWAYRVLKEQPFVLRALARRFPFVIVDEAQDVHSAHSAILDLLQEAGVAVSLIGDPCQAIYEFAGADGSLLRTFGSRSDVSEFTLSTNRRSMPPIVTVANAVSDRSTTGRAQTRTTEDAAPTSLATSQTASMRRSRASLKPFKKPGSALSDPPCCAARLTW